MPKATNLILPPGRSSLGRAESWPLPPDAARILSRVAASSIPVLCLACGGTAFTRIATSLQRASGRSRLERIEVGRDGAARILGLPRGSVSMHIVLALDGLEFLDADGQDVLAAYLEASSPRLLSATRASFEDLEPAWRADLLSLLSTVTVHVPALRDRPEEIPHLAEERLAILCDELALEARPRLAPSAAEALAAHDWPGDVTEFDAVLLGALLLEEPPLQIEAGDLAWRHRQPRSGTPATGPGAAVGRTGTPSGATPPAPESGQRSRPPGRDDDAGTPLESVAVELAHQIQNPLVAVRTFVARAGGGDPAELARLRQFALDGIERINHPLEQLLDFSRLATSIDEDVEVAGALARALEQVEVELEDKSVRVHGLPATALPARGNARNLNFALATLFRHIADTVEPHSPLAISRPAADQIRVRYRTTAVARHLREVTGDPDSSFPLALLLVRGALTRMGAGLRAAHAQNEVTIELSFTTA